MDGFVSAFLTHLRVERQASVHTLRSYEHDLGLYCRYLNEAKGEGADPSDGRPGTAASLFGLAVRSGLRRKHRGPSSGQFALILPVSEAAGVGPLRPVGRSA